MLLELKVSNFAIIENIHIHFKKGLNILTGETGAGKSVLLKSLSLLMGHKGSSESIRTGYNQASIEGSFDISKRPDIKLKLKDLGIEAEEDLLIVKRVLAADKSRVYLNGSMCTLNTLRGLVSPLIEVAGHVAPLIEMTGQFDNRHLLSKDYHLDLLDQYAGTWKPRKQYEQSYQEWKKLQHEIDELKQSAQSQAQRIDFLNFQIEEISSLNLNEQKDSSLEVTIKKMKNSSRLIQFIDQAEDALVLDQDSAINRILTILKKTFELNQMVPELSKKVEGLKQAQIIIEDTTYELRKYSQQVESNPEELERLESRLSQIRKLQKKYGLEISTILKHLYTAEEELSKLKNYEKNLETLEQKFKEQELTLRKTAQDLHKHRENAVELLSNSVNKELLDLNMKGVTFHVQIFSTNMLSHSGTSDIEFMSQTSNKDPKRPLAKFASGGELSRILLSLKRVVGDSDQPRTYLFDEVDTGVSGPTSEKVGKKLHTISKGQQVICVTHLPQVAAYGDAHFFIQKSEAQNSVNMEVTELTSNNRVKEIARLISGEKITKTSLAHAESLLDIL